MAKLTYTVARRHMAERLYERGETRTAEANEVAHLVRAGVLTPPEDGEREAKAEAPLQNKAEGAAPRNKRVRA
ncbi:hypothetical protein [Ancylobacter sp. IITR112]|uniref:hypothetical protein n=1 Tax=Ancylobacter sp. IITR112 TaxID=3138073 RepID=UPI00352BA860